LAHLKRCGVEARQVRERLRWGSFQLKRVWHTWRFRASGSRNTGGAPSGGMHPPTHPDAEVAEVLESVRAGNEAAARGIADYVDQSNGGYARVQYLLATLLYYGAAVRCSRGALCEGTCGLPRRWDAEAGASAD